MGKRSDFPPRKHGEYYTPPSAVAPLVRYLVPGAQYIEPCAGTGAIVRYLSPRGFKCAAAFDIAPGLSLGVRVEKRDATLLASADVPEGTSYAITNPPWPSRSDRHTTIAIVENMLHLGLRAAMLLPAGLMHTRYTATLLRNHCSEIISVGRVKWIEDSPHTSLNDACWYIFKPEQNLRAPRFHPRG